MDRIELSPDQQRGHDLLRGALHDLMEATAGVGLGRIAPSHRPAQDAMVKTAAAMAALWPVAPRETKAGKPAKAGKPLIAKKPHKSKSAHVRRQR